MSTPILKKVFQFLSDYPHPIYLVGGSVRQLLLGKAIKDYDFIVSSGAIELASQLAKHIKASFFVLDQERDMARVVLKNIDLDFACFGQTIETDLCARDLTINAIACEVTPDLLDLPIEHWRLYDPCDGKKDLTKRIIRAISLRNFECDPLRLLRAYRFAAVLNFQLDQQTETWINQSKYLIQNIAFERILQELFLILSTSNSALVMNEINKIGLWQILSKQTLSPDCLISLMHFENMLTRQLDDVSLGYLEIKSCFSRSNLFVLKLALCFFSADKISDLSSSIENVGHWTLSVKEFKLLDLWSRCIPQIIDLLHTELKLESVRLFYLFRNTGIDILGAILIIKVWTLSGQLQLNIQQLNLLADIWLDENNPIAHPKQLIDGKQLMQELNLKPGPLIGKLLLSVQEAQACGKLVNSTEALAFAKASVKKLSTNHAQ